MPKPYFLRQFALLVMAFCLLSVAQAQDLDIDNSLYAKGDPWHGNPNGDVVIVEFFDYNCGYCRQAHAELQQLIQNDNKLLLVYKEFPILSKASLYAARAALAADKQGKYNEFHTALMESRGRIGENKVLAIAKKLGLDSGRLQDDMFAEDITVRIENNYQLAENLNINGTPSFVIGRQLILGSMTMQDMRKEIAYARTTP